MIIWSGWGILAILPVVVMLVVGDGIDTSGLGLEAEQRDGLFWMATGVGALFVFALDRWRASRDPDRVLVDPQTGQEVVYRRQDSLFHPAQVHVDPLPRRGGCGRGDMQQSRITGMRLEVSPCCG
jgi:hypothetical protein